MHLFSDSWLLLFRQLQYNGTSLLISEKEMDCLAMPRGFFYLGEQTYSISGKRCSKWEDGPEIYRRNLPDERTPTASNFCRYIPHQNWSEPSCLVEREVGIKVIEPCGIPYCGGMYTITLQ
jgi:hypothetical protein